jgi:hypothetical protein
VGIELFSLLDLQVELDRSEAELQLGAGSLPHRVEQLAA